MSFIKSSINDAVCRVLEKWKVLDNALALNSEDGNALISELCRAIMVVSVAQEKAAGLGYFGAISRIAAINIHLVAALTHTQLIAASGDKDCQRAHFNIASAAVSYAVAAEEELGAE